MVGPNQSCSRSLMAKLTPKEKQISFYNNYFIYKKIRNVDTNAVYNTMIGSSKFQEQLNKLKEEELSAQVEF